MSQPRPRQANQPTKSKSPTPSFEPRRICILGEYEARRFENRDTTLHRCSNSGHPHYTRSRVEQLVKDGQLEWVGVGRKIAKFVTGRTWVIKPSGPVSAMQMVPGGAVLTKTDYQKKRRAIARSVVRSLKEGTL